MTDQRRSWRQPWLIRELLRVVRPRPGRAESGPVDPGRFAPRIEQVLEFLGRDAPQALRRYVAVEGLEFGDNPHLDEVSIRFRLEDEPPAPMDAEMIAALVQPRLATPRRNRPILGPRGRSFEGFVYDYTFRVPRRGGAEDFAQAGEDFLSFARARLEEEAKAWSFDVDDGPKAGGADPLQFETKVAADRIRDLP